MKIGVNMEFSRDAEFSFQEGVERAAGIGYDYVEPNVSTGYDLLATGGHYHMLSVEEDPLEYRELTDELGLTVESVSSHAPLMEPEKSVRWLRRAIEWVDAWGGDVVNTSEGGHRPAWMDYEDAFDMMRYTLTKVTQTAERRDVRVGVEPHEYYTKDVETFNRLLGLVDSPAIGINYDTGNVYMQGNDPVDFLDALGPERVVHLHAKDISVEQSADRGGGSGTTVGCAVGDGLVDWPAVFDLLEGGGFDGVVSVECGTIEEAERSYEYLTDLAADRQALTA